MKSEDVFAFAQFIGIETRQKGEELEFKECPLCHGGRHDEWTFSINTVTGAFCCLRATCGYKGHFVELCRDFDFPLENTESKMFKKIPQPGRHLEPDNTAIKYLEARGISKEVADRYEIFTHRNHPKWLVFPFYDENGALQTIKYRNMAFVKGKSKWKEKFVAETKPILFGMKQCVDFSTLIITEGQIDALTVAECGFKNVVSVPNGANGSSWIVHCYDWVNKFGEIIIFGDYEKGKITLVDMISSRFKVPIRIVRKQDYLGEKDANDILKMFGKDAVRKCIENAELPRMENVRDLSTVRSVDLNELETIKTGISEVDKVTGGMILGQVILLTGKRGEGKSTFLSQMVCSALDQNRSVFIYSGELPSFHFKRWLDLQLAGSHNIITKINEFGVPSYSISEETVQRISDWYKGRAYIYDNSYIPSSTAEQETLIETIEKVIRQYNVQFVCIDNLMTAMESVEDKDNLYLAQSNFVGKLKELAIRFQVAIMLVAHPRKSKEEFVNDDVSGASEITNKVDIVMSYRRSTSEKKEEDSQLLITKNRLFGRLATGKEAIDLCYSEASKRISSQYDKSYIYGWEKNDFENLDELEDLPF